MNKNILIISPHNPFLRSNGGENRIYLRAKELLDRGQVVIIAPIGKREKGSFKVYQIYENKPSKKLFNFNLIYRINEIIKKEGIDKIYLEFPWQGINLILTGNRYTLEEHNVEFLRFKRTGSLLWPIIYLYELFICKFADRIICVSKVDKEYISKYFVINPKNIEIIENPVDRSIFYPNSKNNNKLRKSLHLSKGEKMVLFFGQLNYKPNVQALNIINNELIPRLNKKNIKYKIVICGKGDGEGILKSSNNPDLIFAGFVERIQDYINASDVVIAPLLSGSGTRIKILEALACKKRVISTSIGAEGIKQNKLLEVEDDWQRFVEKIIQR